MTAEAPGARAPIVDVHGHYVPPGLIDRIRDTPSAGSSVLEKGPDQYSFILGGAPPSRVLPARLIDLHERQAWMDEQGIHLQVLGTWADIFGYWLDPADGVEWARLLNETLIEAIGGSTRFAAFASLPMQDPEAAAKVMAEAMANGFQGVTIAARIEEVELDDQRLEPFWAAASDLGVMVFIHPGYGSDSPRTTDYGLVNAVGRGMDTTIAASRLLFAGIPTRFPGARILLAHGGGALPFLLGRLQRNHQISPSLADPEVGFARLLFDSVVFDPAALCYLHEKAAPGAIMLGSDYPFPIGDAEPVRVVAEAACLNDEQRRSILGEAARAALGLGPVPGVTISRHRQAKG
jgi:aminocarboxymuconate-semialdehyde decarboxylase